MKALVAATLVASVITLAPSGASAQQYRFSVVASGLSSPRGIAIKGSDDVYFTEVPEPGVGGGRNGVSSLDLESGEVVRVHSGEPEPTNIAVAPDGDVYWTCKSAGVILRMMEDGGVAPFATNLEQPSGITVWRHGAVVYTEVPTPGVPGTAGGRNRVTAMLGDRKYVLSRGEPEPVDVVVARSGDLYWTCKTAGVILERSFRTGRISVLRSGLDMPTGIAIDHKGETLYFTEVPTPGVPGSAGGRNKVRALNLQTGVLRSIHEGDPEPTDVAVARNGNVYWTCTSAGVIVEAKRLGRSD